MRSDNGTNLPRKDFSTWKHETLKATPYGPTFPFGIALFSETEDNTFWHGLVQIFTFKIMENTLGLCLCSLL